LRTGIPAVVQPSLPPLIPSSPRWRRLENLSIVSLGIGEL
jgi:hypothetical protein